MVDLEKPKNGNSKKEVEFLKPYKLAHQILSLTGINFTHQTVIGFTELTLIPIKDSFRYIWINCKQACVYKIVLNDILEVPFQYFDPLLNVCAEESKARSLASFKRHQLNAVASVDAELGRGELLITISSEAQHLIQEGKPLRVGIEFSLEKPRSGLHFVLPPGDGTLAQRGVHMFSCGNENSNSLWFPCIDTYNEVCTWKLEFTIDEVMVAVSCGDLLEIVYTADMRRKTYHYKLDTPTSASNIALAVGPFEIYVDPHMNEITHFCLPRLVPVMKITSKHLHEAFEFFEEILSYRYPHSTYKQVYVDEAYNDVSSYSTMSIVTVNLLCSTRVIDQVFETRRAFVLCVAQQFFSCFISRNTWADAWLTGGISRYLMGLHMRRFLGFNEYKDWVHSELEEVLEYEKKYGPVTLDPSDSRLAVNAAYKWSDFICDNTTVKDESEFYFSVKSAHACSPKYIEMYYKKAHLAIRMVEFKIGYELMMQVLNKHLSLGLVASQHKGHPSGWLHMVISTATFTKTIFTVTGKDIKVFCDQWVREGGHAHFKMRFIFNRKRNIVEMTVEQSRVGEFGIKRYVGPAVVWLQELDGTFKHTVQIEHLTSRKEIVCHSKSRRNKKKKIPLCTGEEVDMDLSHLDIDSPVLWLRLDPDMTLMRAIEVEQPDNLWMYQLRHERDVTAQTNAINALARFAHNGAVTTEMRNTLNHILENEQCYYKVRCRAAHCLAHVANAMVSSWSGPPAMMQIFKKMFCSFSSSNMIKMLDFTNFHHYFLLKAMPVAMATLRDAPKEVPDEVLQFILNLFKYNDNSKNQFSDNYHRASLVDALAAAVTPSKSGLDSNIVTPDLMPENAKTILREVTRSINVDNLLPCYKRTVTCACLRAIRIMQKFGHIPSKSDLFRAYSSYPLFIDIRKNAIDQLIDFLHEDGTYEDLNFVIRIIESDPVAYFRYYTAQRMAENPPFQVAKNHWLDTEHLVERLWSIINSTEAYDSRVRCAVVDLYFSLYGSHRPACLPGGYTEHVPVSLSRSHDKRSRNLVAPSSDVRVNTPDIASSTDTSLALNIKKEPMEVDETTLPDTQMQTQIPVNVSETTMPAISAPNENVPVRVKQEILSDDEAQQFKDTSPPFTATDVQAQPLPFITQPLPFNTTQPQPPVVTQPPPPVVSQPLQSVVNQAPTFIPPFKIKEEAPDPILSPNPEIMDYEDFATFPAQPNSTATDPLQLNTTNEITSTATTSSYEVSAPSALNNLTEPDNVISDLNKHKLKKKKKDKKHKKHKKYKQHKLEKFAEEGDLSSGSSNPPSPTPPNRDTSPHRTID